MNKKQITMKWITTIIPNMGLTDYSSNQNFKRRITDIKSIHNKSHWSSQYDTPSQYYSYQSCSSTRSKILLFTASHSLGSSPGGSRTASLKFPLPKVASMCFWSCAPCIWIKKNGGSTKKRPYYQKKIIRNNHKDTNLASWRGTLFGPKCFLVSA